MLTSIAPMLSAYTKNLYSKIPLNLGLKFRPMWSAGPNTYVKPELDTHLTVELLGGKRLSIWHTLPIDGSALLTFLKPEFHYSIGSMWFKPRTFYVSDGWQNPIPPCDQGAKHYLCFIDRLCAIAAENWWPKMRTRPENGRFGVKLEGAGKIRVFAIANPILQTLLRPLHDWCMKVLKLLPTDGTYDQLKPLKRLQGKNDFLS